jgi:hypothetical protein
VLLCCFVVSIASIPCIFAIDAQVQQTESDSQSKILLLASVLPAVNSSESAITIENCGDAKSGKVQRRKLAINLLSGMAVALAFDKSVEKYSEDDLRGKTTIRLANFFNGLGSMDGLGLLSTGYFVGDDESRRTYGLAFQAIGEAMLITQSLKFLVGRERPNQSDGDPYEFHGPSSEYQSFPSGHTSNAFAIATVFADKNPNMKWIYYGLATCVGLSRIQSRSHFLSDVFVGATIGIYAGHKATKGKSLIKKLRLH